jgi:hypothetical protein
MIERLIKQEEKNLIAYLLEQVSTAKEYRIPNYVSDLDDGGMGSLQLNNGKHFKDLIQVEYIDLDGQKVIITLTENENRELFDLDFWKVDFEPLKKFPLPEELKRF